MRKNLFLLIIFVFSSVFIFKGATWAQSKSIGDIDSTIKTSSECTKNNDCGDGFRCLRGRCSRIPNPTTPPQPPPPQPTAIPKPTATPKPTAVILPQTTATPTPTPDPEETTTPPAIGAKDYCQGITISGSNLTSGGNLTLTATAKNTNIKTFSYRFYNTDNANKAIIFKIGGTNRNYTRTIKNSFTSSSNTITINFSQLDRNDLNWTSPVYGHPKPKNIKVAAYFTDAANATSKNAAACEATFTASTIDPTPTPNPNCKCASNVCNTTYCKFDKHTTTSTTITYAGSQGCGINGIFQSTPTADHKNAWCKRYFITKGDANGDGKATFIDYFYYLAARVGGKVPPTVNPDFNGNNLIDDIDKEIIIKSLK